MKLRKSMLALSAFVLPMSLSMLQPAAAATPHADAAIIQGSGTISPSLGLIPGWHSVSFSGTATAVGTDGILATYGCSFSGTGFGNILGGPGTVSGSCGPLNFELCAFLLTGAVVDVLCSKAEVGVAYGVGQGECVFRPHQLFPVESYDLTCEASTAVVEL